MTRACAPGATARAISLTCFCMASVSAYGMIDRDTSIAARTDRAEQIGVLVALILRLTRARALLGPLVGETVLLSDPHFILEPHLDRGCGCKLAHYLCDTRGKVFFECRNRMLILCRVPGSGADARKIEPLENAPKTHFRQIDAEAFTKHPLEVHASPTHHPILVGIGAGFHELTQLFFLLRRQRRWATR